jgi:UDP-N-acetylglucosamine 2-epimerase (non-hydrolysing)
VDLVVGARPNLVKAAPVRAALLEEGRLAPRIVHSGQHATPELFGRVRLDVGLPAPDISLGLRGASSRDAGAIERAYRRVLAAGPDQPGPAAVVVFGDVTSTVAAARAAVAAGIPVAHVESGLRCFDPSMAEERNRVETDRLASLLLATEPSAMENLARERCAGHAVLVGNPMIDTLLATLGASSYTPAALGLGLSVRGYALATLHRAENVDDPIRLAELVGALIDAARSLPVVWLSHPRTTARIAAAGLAAAIEAAPGLRVLAPLPYATAVSLLADARVVMTDSGGLSEEAAFLGVPCLILRDRTERPVVVDEGSAVIAGTRRDGVGAALGQALARPPRGPAVTRWDGAAGPRIAAALAAAYAPRDTRTRPRTAKASA